MKKEGYRSEAHAGVDDRGAALLGLDDGGLEEGNGAEVALVRAQRRYLPRKPSIHPIVY